MKTIFLFIALFSTSEGLTIAKPPAKAPPLTQPVSNIYHGLFQVVASTLLLTTILATDPALADAGVSKINAGGASTLQSGRTISITRGVNLDGADFSGQNLKGVAF